MSENKAAVVNKKKKQKGNHTHKPGKRLLKQYESFDKDMFYSLDEALDVLSKIQASKASFEESLDIVIKLGVDPKYSDQVVRSSVLLPNGIGKQVKVAVFAKGEKASEAKKAGAEIVGAEELCEEIMQGSIDFDRCVATPDMMAHVGKLGKVLGPKGLMPNPKLGTVTFDVAQAVEALKKGQVEFKAEKAGIVHATVGKLSFAKEALVGNIKHFVNAVVAAKPSGAKGTYIKGIFLSPTMGASVKVDVATVG